MLSLLVILPMYMQMTLLIAAFTTGLILLPDSLLNCVLAPTIGRMFDKYGPKAVITPGTILVALGYGVYSQFGTDTALWLIVLTHIIMMLGIGIVLASVQTNTLNSLPKHTTRMASPYVNEIRKVSIDAASVILSTIGFGGLVYGVSVAGNMGWTSATVLGAIAVVLLALIAFSVRQTSMKNPMLNMKAFQYPLFVLG